MAEGNWAASQYVPIGHVEHEPAPGPLNVPGAQGTCIDEVELRGQAKPGEHTPEHEDALNPVTLPNEPAGHAF